MNWHERIERARTRGHFVPGDVRKATGWVTCACGEQDQRILRNADRSPCDLTLQNYGIAFAHAVLNDLFATAKRLLGKIEARAAELLQEAS